MEPVIKNRRKVIQVSKGDLDALNYKLDLESLIALLRKSADAEN
jgi:hypothetical protein